MSAALLHLTHQLSHAQPTPTPASTQPSHPFPLLDLPLEIRLLIYHHALTHASIPHLRLLSTRAHCSDYVLPSPPLVPALLATCRAVAAEATPVLYGANVFAAHPQLLTALPYLVRSSQPIRDAGVAARIRRWWLHVRLDTDAPWDSGKVEDAFSGVEELQLEVFQAQFGSCGYEVLRRFVGVRGVRRAKVFGSVEEGFARWLEGVMMSESGAVVKGFEEGRGEYDLWTHGGR
ncbi:MAG: hypothetical protein M1821_000194 [Bathelium mastoideum]|nr:MAG: hypothetical protein M1821_000194 [Bathelium mastoideum]